MKVSINVQIINIKERFNNINLLFFSETTIMSKYRPEDEAAEGAAAPKPKAGGAAAAGGGAAVLAGAPKMKG